MKQIFLWLCVAVLLSGCTGGGLTGRYINYAQSDYSVAWTTLTIQKAGSGSGNLYRIRKSVLFQRKLSDTALGKVEQKEDVLTGTWNRDNRSLQTSYPEPFLLDATGDTLSIGDVLYVRVRGR